MSRPWNLLGKIVSSCGVIFVFVENIRKLFGWWGEVEFFYDKLKNWNVVIDFILSPPGQLLVILSCLGFLSYPFFSSRKRELGPPISLREGRIPYVEIRQLANARGWKLNDDSPQCVNRAYCLESAMRQAASDGSLLVCGRRCESPTGSNPLLLIPKEHFIDFEFHYGYLNRDNVENISTYTWKPEPGKNKNSFSGQNYCDLYVSRRGIKRLLRRVMPSDGVVTSSMD